MPSVEVMDRHNNVCVSRNDRISRGGNRVRKMAHPATMFRVIGGENRVPCVGVFRSRDGYFFVRPIGTP